MVFIQTAYSAYFELLIVRPKIVTTNGVAWSNIANVIFHLDRKMARSGTFLGTYMGASLAKATEAVAAWACISSALLHPAILPYTR